jgi:hypothetical protein
MAGLHEDMLQTQRLQRLDPGPLLKLTASQQQVIVTSIAPARSATQPAGNIASAR